MDSDTASRGDTPQHNSGKLVTRGQVAEILGISYPRVADWLAKGILPRPVICRKDAWWRWSRDEIEALAKSKEANNG